MSILLIEKPPCGFDALGCFGTSDRVWSGIRTGLAVIFGLIAYASLIPASFASLIWKAVSVTANLIDGKD